MSDATHWDWLSDSVLLYTSHDLSDWKRRATVFTAAAVPGDVRQRLAGSSNGPLRCVALTAPATIQAQGLWVAPAALCRMPGSTPPCRTVWTMDKRAGSNPTVAASLLSNCCCCLSPRVLVSSPSCRRLERPKVLYNAAHRYYVLFVSLSSLDRSRAEVGWAVSVSPYGPFKLDGARCAGHSQSVLTPLFVSSAAAAIEPWRQHNEPLVLLPKREKNAAHSHTQNCLPVCVCLLMFLCVQAARRAA